MIKEEIVETLKKSVTVIGMLPVTTKVSVHVVGCCLCAAVSWEAMSTGRCSLWLPLLKQLPCLKNVML